MTGLVAHWLAGWLTGWVAGWLTGWVAGWLGGSLAWWLGGSLAGPNTLLLYGFQNSAYQQCMVLFGEMLQTLRKQKQTALLTLPCCRCYHRVYNKAWPRQLFSNFLSVTKSGHASTACRSTTKTLSTNAALDPFDIKNVTASKAASKMATATTTPSKVTTTANATATWAWKKYLRGSWICHCIPCQGVVNAQLPFVKRPSIQCLSTSCKVSAQHSRKVTPQHVLASHSPDHRMSLNALKECESSADSETADAIMEHIMHCGIKPSAEHCHAWLASTNPRNRKDSVSNVVFEKLSVDEATVLSALLGALRYRAWTHFANYLHWIDEHDIKPSQTFYRQLLEQLSGSHQLPPAEFVLSHAKEHGVALDPVTVSAMFNLNHYFRRFGRVVELYDDYIEGPAKMTVKTFSVAINALTFSENVVDAERMFRDITARAQLPLQLPHFTALMNVYGEAGRLEDVVHTFSAIEQAQRQPDHIMFVTVLRACGRARHSKQAVRVWEKMTKKYGIVPQEAAWNAYIKAHMDPDNMTSVMRLTQEMRASGIPVTIFYFNHLIDALADLDRPEDARQLYQKALDSKLRPTYDTFLHLIRAYEKRQDISNMVSVYHAFHESSVTRNDCRIYNILLTAYAERNMWDHVLGVVEDMLDRWILLNADSFVPVLKAAVSRGNAASVATNLLCVDMQRHVAAYDHRHLAIVMEGLLKDLNITSSASRGGEHKATLTDSLARVHNLAQSWLKKEDGNVSRNNGNNDDSSINRNNSTTRSSQQEAQITAICTSDSDAHTQTLAKNHIRELVRAAEHYFT
eukprot:gene7007-9596_t